MFNIDISGTLDGIGTARLAEQGSVSMADTEFVEDCFISTEPSAKGANNKREYFRGKALGSKVRD